jgi:hypothetical protein
MKNQINLSEVQKECQNSKGKKLEVEYFKKLLKRNKILMNKFELLKKNKKMVFLKYQID